MFSGIVETTGLVTKITNDKGCKHIIFSPKKSFDDIAIGDSISMNGVCITVTQKKMQSFHTTVVPETLRLTNLAMLKEDDEINLERSIKADQRISGHYVQGHVDGRGEILSLENDGVDNAARIAKISLPSDLHKYIIKKGYIAIDGMSITVMDIAPDYFTVTFIPHTQQETIVKHYREKMFVNLEVDMLSKYIEKLIGNPRA